MLGDSQRIVGKKWEEKQPETAESYAQQNPTFNNPIA